MSGRASGFLLVLLGLRQATEAEKNAIADRDPEHPRQQVGLGEEGRQPVQHQAADAEHDVEGIGVGHQPAERAQRAAPRRSASSLRLP